MEKRPTSSSSPTSAAKDDLLIDDGIDASSSTFYISGTVDQVMHRRVYNALTILNKQPKPKGRRKEQQPIKMIFNTYGGDVNYAFSIYDLLRQSSRPVQVIVAGPCMSAGTLIIQGAAIRTSLANSQFMVHFGSQPADSGREWRHNDRMHKRWIDIIADRVSATRDEVEEWHDTEHYMTATEAVATGLIDNIVDEGNSK